MNPQFESFDALKVNTDKDKWEDLKQISDDFDSLQVDLNRLHPQDDEVYNQ
jgi:hypothetical protein